MYELILQTDPFFENYHDYTGETRISDYDAETMRLAYNFLLENRQKFPEKKTLGTNYITTYGFKHWLSTVLETAYRRHSYLDDSMAQFILEKLDFKMVKIDYKQYKNYSAKLFIKNRNLPSSTDTKIVRMYKFRTIGQTLN